MEEYCVVFRRVFTFRMVLGLLLFLIYVNMPQAVNSNLFLYAANSCVMFQHEDFVEIEEQAFIQAVLLMSVIEQKLSFGMF